MSVLNIKVWNLATAAVIRRHSLKLSRKTAWLTFVFLQRRQRLQHRFFFVLKARPVRTSLSHWGPGPAPAGLTRKPYSLRLSWIFSNWNNRSNQSSRPCIGVTKALTVYRARLVPTLKSITAMSQNCSCGVYRDLQRGAGTAALTEQINDHNQR